MDSWIIIATIASPIISAIAIIVALWISRRSSQDAQKQIDTLHAQLGLMHEQQEVFMAAQAPDMNAKLKNYQKQLQQLDRQIAETQREYETVNPFYGWGGARIDDIEYEFKKGQQKQNLNTLRKQRQNIVQQIQLIQTFLDKQN